VTGAEPEQRLTLAEITNAAAILFDVTVEELKASTRVRRVAYPRQVAMAVCRELTDASFPKIGWHFGDRDHTTVLYAYRKVSRGALSEQANSLRALLTRPDVRAHLTADRERKRLEAVAAAEKAQADRLIRQLVRARIASGFHAATTSGVVL